MRVSSRITYDMDSGPSGRSEMMENGGRFTQVAGWRVRRRARVSICTRTATSTGNSLIKHSISLVCSVFNEHSFQRRMDGQ